jgi:hypothetical protein
MKRAIIALVLCVAATLVGCKSSTSPDDMKLKQMTLLSNLEFPKGMWVHEGTIYLTETAGRNTTFGGKVQLDEYDIASGQLTVVKHDLDNCDAVVVASDGMVYLCSPHGGVPGDLGTVTVFNPIDTTETHVTSVSIAAEDMFITSGDDIYLIGPSDSPDATSLLRLPRGSYSNYSVVANDLLHAWCVTVAGGYLFFSDQYMIQRIVPAPQGGPLTFEPVLRIAVNSLSPSPTNVYYGDYDTGTVGRFDLANAHQVTLLSGLHSPQTVRWSASNNTLYFLEAGTEANQYKDGTLKAITNVR